MISLKAAKPGFIGTNNLNSTMINDIETIRQFILNSVKFVFDKSLLDLSETNERIALDQLKFIAQTKDDDKIQPDKLLTKVQDKQFPIWKKYGTKLPYPVVFFENETGGLLLIQEEENIICYIIHSNGFIRHISVKLGEEFFNTDLYKLPVPYAINSKTTSDLKSLPKELAYRLETESTLSGFLAYKLITFINAQNVSIVKCKPTNKEFDKAKITNVSKPKYVYHIVDIYNSKKQYKSLKDIVKFANTPVNKDIKAHIVRGHFKTRATGVYWWNSFIRCKDGPGKVIKHYECHDSEG